MTAQSEPQTHSINKKKRMANYINSVVFEILFEILKKEMIVNLTLIRYML